MTLVPLRFRGICCPRPMDAEGPCAQVQPAVRWRTHSWDTPPQRTDWDVSSLVVPCPYPHSPDLQAHPHPYIPCILSQTPSPSNIFAQIPGVSPSYRVRSWNLEAFQVLVSYYMLVQPEVCSWFTSTPSRTPYSCHEELAPRPIGSSAPQVLSARAGSQISHTTYWLVPLEGH